MRLRFGRGGIKSVILLGATVMFGAGCFWQRDSYSTKMRTTMKNWERDEELRRLLGDPFSTGDPIWFRPPKTVQLVQQPDDPPKFSALFQGGTPMVEVVLYHSQGGESMPEFETAGLALLNSTQKGPGGQLQRMDPASVTSMHDNSTMTFNLFSAQAPRQFAGADGQPGQPVACNWLVYFTEEPPQKIMIAYIIPDSLYEQISSELQKSLEGLALGAKVAIAQGGAPAPAAPAAPAGGPAPDGAAAAAAPAGQ
jgi:hypothetical protein